MSITTVLFDLGSTLIYSKDPWPPIYQRADLALVEVLNRAGIPIIGQSFHAEFDSFLDAYYDRRGADLIERTTQTTLCELLDEKGFRDVPDPVVRSALDAMYSVTQSNWYIEDDAIPTLETLRAGGYRLGMISNTSDDKNVQELLDRWGLRMYFEIIVTSAALGFRKPHPYIFQLALNHFGIPPERAAMVGDTPCADVLGANQIGINSIWITRRAAAGSDPDIRPRSVVDSLAQIPSLLQSIP